MMRAMTILAFPPIDKASEEGLLAVGGDLEIASLKLAYQSGIFPWPMDGYPLLWFAPPERAILEFKEVKISRRLQRELKKPAFTYHIDRNFDQVIRFCAVGWNRRSSGTWITPDMVEAYVRFHRAGFAHSFECYNRDDDLVGGLYGVAIGSYFAGESMFFHESGASKAALLYAVDYLRAQGGTWMDIQMVSPLLKNFGAREISRASFMTKLKRAIKRPDLFAKKANKPKITVD